MAKAEPGKLEALVAQRRSGSTLETRASNFSLLVHREKQIGNARKMISSSVLSAAWRQVPECRGSDRPRGGVTSVFRNDDAYLWMGLFGLNA
jgi:hypothetical protein